MANNKLILRTLTSTWVYPTTDITKNSVLTHTDVDNNFIYLKGEVVYTAQTSGTDLILNKVNNSNITIDLSSMNNGSGAFTSTTANNSIIPTIPFGNSNDSDNASILGGSNNTITTGYTSSVIGGGSGNTMPSYSPITPFQNEYFFSVTNYDNNIAGGSNNQISSYASTIGGGSGNQIGKGFVYTYGAYGYYYESRFGGGSIISGGLDNIIGDYSALSNIDGGEKNRIGVLGRYSSYANWNVKWNTIGGGYNNLIYATVTGTSSSINLICGGRNNKIKDTESSVIGGGFNNWIVDSRECTNNGMASRTYNSWGSSISGRLNKIIGADKSVISGGEFNVIKSGSTYSFIGGGEKNVVKSASTYSSIVGGSGNTITSSNFSTIVGGQSNIINHSNSHIIGSNITSVSANTTHVEKLNVNTLNGTIAVTSLAIDADGMVVDGTSLGGVDGPFTSTTANNTIIPTIPFNNVNDGAYSSILGGGNNTISGGGKICQTIAGGGFNSVSENFSTVGGGEKNEIESSHSFVGSGYKNKIIPTSTTGKENSIVGGKLNLIGGVSNKSTIVGGLSNIITGSTSSTIGGGELNEIDMSHGFIGGGSTNHIVDGVKSIIGGGQQNEIHEQHSFIGGGLLNKILTSNNGQSNSIVGGSGNIVYGVLSTVGGGKNNHIITGWGNTIAGGFDNTTNLGGKNIIGGGDNNTINNHYYSSILGGQSNIINHSNSHIIGSNITSVSANTTHVEKLNVNTLNGTTSVAGLGIDANGMIVSATTSPVINEINDNLILEGTTNATTSQAIYGVNIITTATTLDLATRLPAPTTGRQTVFINNSLLPIKVFPSVVGGEINGVVDGVSSIPNDGRAYTFYCTQNPLPGAWTWSAPAIQQLALQEMEINHTYGVSSAGFNAGQGTANESSVGLGWAGSGVLETGTWNTNNFPAWVEKFKVYTNIKWADIAGGNINAFFTQGYQNTPTGTSTGNKAAAQFAGNQAFPGPNIQEVLGGTAGDNVGDIGTLYMELPFTNGYPLSRIIGNQAITNPIPGNTETCYSKGYYTFEMNINLNATTKLYKFQWFIEYS
jgi:hypothetical protein